MGNYSFMIRIIGWVLLVAALILLQAASIWTGMAMDTPVTPKQATWLTHATVGLFGMVLILLAGASALMQPRPMRLWRFVGTLALSSVCCSFVAVFTETVFSSFYSGMARSLLRYIA